MLLLVLLLRRSVNFWAKFFLYAESIESCGIRAQGGYEQAQ